MKLLLLFLLGTPVYALSEDGFHPEPCPTQLNSQIVVPITIKSNEYQYDLEGNSTPDGN
jgi:hypothetical protein